MQQHLCVTGNKMKYHTGRSVLAKYGITLEQAVADIPEIQDEDAAKITRDKAEKAYGFFREPVIVTDDSWEIPGLGGFPGPYMKSMNQWFTPEDFIRLTAHLGDRTIRIHRYLAFHDGQKISIFHSTLEGTIATEPRGIAGEPIQKVTLLAADQGKTISEAYDQTGIEDNHRYTSPGDAWHQLGEFLRDEAVRSK